VGVPVRYQPKILDGHLVYLPETGRDHGSDLWRLEGLREVSVYAPLATVLAPRGVFS
jgi:hypothetical protein